MKKNNLAKIVFVLMILTFAQHVVKGQNPDSIVWPGDANNNGIVNQFDVLYIGASYGNQGPMRDFVSIAWEGQDVAQNWPFFGNDLYTGFADCNGNGFIGDEDLQAVEVNYGLSHDSIYPDTFSLNDVMGDTEISFDTMGGIVQGSAGQAYTIAIDLGTNGSLVENFYSLAFDINVNTDFINLESVSFIIDNTWIDSNNSGLLSIQKKDFANNTLNVALSRKNLQPVEGSGRIGYISFVIIDDVPGFAPNTEVFTFQNTKVLDNNLRETHYIEQKSLVIDFTNRITELPRSEFSIFPNPVNNGFCTIKGLENYPDANIRLIDIMGREIKASLVGNNLVTNHLPSGVYFININTSKGRLTEKIIINN